jgi:hypothetical protein
MHKAPEIIAEFRCASPALTNNGTVLSATPSRSSGACGNDYQYSTDFAAPGEKTQRISRIST